MTDDIKAAVEAAKTEAGVSAEPEPEVTETKTASEPEARPEPEKDKADPKAEPDDDDDDFWKPTAEELALIEQNPALKKAYKSMQRGMTKKSQSIKEQLKANEQREKLFNWINSEPEAAANAILASLGKSPTPTTPKQEEKLADKLEAKWAETVGPEAAKLLRPLIEETISNVVEKELTPLKSRTEQLSAAAQERAIAASVNEFGAGIVKGGEEWDDDIAAEMAKVTDKLQPGPDTTIDDFLRIAYDTVMANRSRMVRAKEARARLRRIKQEAEPGDRSTRSVDTKTPDRVSPDMPDKDAFSLALKLAEKELKG